MEYRMCSKCVMDTTDEAITFNNEGVCNHCIEAFKRLPQYHFTDAEEKHNLEELEANIKSKKKGKYDSVVGLSGGVDSSYIALMAKRMGLNPLCVHFDNGWNSEIAVNNIKKIVNKCNFDLETYVIDWPEFKDLQRAFLKAGVIDIELLTDHAILATMFKLRAKHKIDYILSGNNYVTEHGLPKSWVWNKLDFKNIKSIHKIYGTKKIKKFPTTSQFKMLLNNKLGLGGVYAEPINMVNYSKTRVMEELEKEFDWQYYGGKHYESVFTKFYQAYILPLKFNVDKRKVHLSALVRNAEITKEEALEALKKDLYNPSELTNDKQYVLKKLDFTEIEFDAIMKEKPRKHSDFPFEEMKFLNIIKKFRKRG
jgi:N-acetyl sugar amidotransferase